MLARQGVAPAGPPYGRFAFHGDAADVEAGFPVRQAFIRDGRVVMSALPSGHVAVTTYFGPYEQVADAHKDVLAWLEQNGYQEAGPHWEVYYTDPAEEPDPSRWRTDVVVPFASAASLAAR